jgi:hypothetical protein
MWYTAGGGHSAAARLQRALAALRVPAQVRTTSLMTTLHISPYAFLFIYTCAMGHIAGGGHSAARLQRALPALGVPAQVRVPAADAGPAQAAAARRRQSPRQGSGAEVSGINMYRLVAYIAHGRKLISFQLDTLNDSPPLSFTLLNYIDQLSLGCLNDGTLEL